MDPITVKAGVSMGVPATFLQEGWCTDLTVADTEGDDEVPKFQVRRSGGKGLVFCPKLRTPRQIWGGGVATTRSDAGIPDFLHVEASC